MGRHLVFTADVGRRPLMLLMMLMRISVRSFGFVQGEYRYKTAEVIPSNSAFMLKVYLKYGRCSCGSSFCID